MAPAQPCAKYQYIVTSSGPKILPVENLPCKDEESPAEYNAGGYLPISVGDSFKNGRYLVVRKLGWGHFSTVWLVKDLQNRRHSALKVVKSAGRYAETARDEIKLLSQVAIASPSHLGRAHIVSFLDSFVNQSPDSSHVCIVFEPLGENLLSLIQRNKKKGVPRVLVRIITKQILLGLQYLHDECDLVHTDIKPENILISIPDIEAHIHSELSQSPTPTSRHVGVPLPTKTRAGVTIPPNQQRTRRQVQIFESQPLASPGRTIDVKRGGLSGSSGIASICHGSNVSERSKAFGNYIAHMHLTRSGTTTASGTAKSLSSAAAKHSVGSSVSDHKSKLVFLPGPDSRQISIYGVNSHLNGNNPFFLSSSLSSPSSTSSTLASITAGSNSAISTPPTSLSTSLGNVVAGFLGMPKGIDQQQNSLLPAVNSFIDGKQGKARDNIFEEGLQNSKSIPAKLGSFSKKGHSVSSSSYKSPNITKKSKLCQVQSSPHSQPRSGATSSFWKDPGTGAPAPAIVVSAIAGTDSGDDASHYFNFRKVSSVGCSSLSDKSSATATAAVPSPSNTPMGDSPSRRPPSMIAGTKKAAATSPMLLSVEPSVSNIVKATPSLLTQTAPARASHSSSTVSSASSSNHQNISSNVASAYPSDSLDNISSTYSSIRANGFEFSHDGPFDAKLPAETTEASCPLPPSPIPTLKASHSSPPALQLQTSTLSPDTPLSPISVKIADLGNATPSTKHYTEDIQTRQYRAPEAILGKHDWDARVDMWSLACLVFELLTSEFLFDPHGQGERFTKDDDHMAQIIELLGDFALEVKMGGRYSRELFDHAGTLRYIHELHPWPLNRVMIEKYLYSDADATALSDFLLPMLVVDMKQRANARDVLDHPWLTHSPSDDESVSEWW